MWNVTPLWIHHHPAGNPQQGSLPALAWTWYGSLDRSCFFCNLPHTGCMYLLWTPPCPRIIIFATIWVSFKGSNMLPCTDLLYPLHPCRFSLFLWATEARWVSRGISVLFLGPWHSRWGWGWGGQPHVHFTHVLHVIYNDICFPTISSTSSLLLSSWQVLTWICSKCLALQPTIVAPCQQ